MFMFLYLTCIRLLVILYNNSLSHTLSLSHFNDCFFTAEVCAIDFALNIISRDKHNKFIIFSDLLSVLTSLENKKLENPLIVKLFSRLDSMSSQKKIILC